MRCYSRTIAAFFAAISRTLSLCMKCTHPPQHPRSLSSPHWWCSDILFRIRHARKLLRAAAIAEDAATSPRQKAAFEHTEVLQKYNEAICGRLERCVPASEAANVNVPDAELQ